ncbi:hypothetical protein NEAUS04_0776 [Nematocida ausubeli]|nr:hypothetical protein NEAUS06_0778 [Nematocida ausubeli]KAI5146568.1 hypothetical protein NEAUS05_0016 [Nematocida ausubeli]KAI5161904.1 hypothetical protein NEAUS04_0776 [Nematocida ausubeli]
MAVRNKIHAILESLEGRPKPSVYDVEYCMDEADKEIMLYLQERHPMVTEEIYELVIDRLEKEHHFLQRIAVTKISECDELAEECNICGGMETEDDNFLIFCDSCNIAVHQSCYGVPHIPEGSWLCRPCLLSPNKQISCVLCSASGGAYKRTRNGAWCHVLCGLLVPGARFENLSLVEPVDIEDVYRSQHQCSACGFKKGGVAPCAYYGCRRYYHATCAVKSERYIDVANGILFCLDHDPKRKAEGLLTRSPDGNYPVLENTPVIHSLVPLWKPQRRVHAGIESVPAQVCDYVINRIAERDLSAHKNAHMFIRDMYAVWQTRKKERPIIKRLRLDSPADGFKKWGTRVLPKIEIIQRETHILDMFKMPQEIVLPSAEKYMYEVYAVASYKMQKLTETAERTAHNIHKGIAEMQKNHVNLISRMIDGYGQMQILLDALERTDRHSLFMDQITDSIAPGYSSIVKVPVSFSLIQKKIDRLKYKSFGEVVKDVELLISNAYAYNGHDSFIGIETRRIEETLSVYTLKEGDIVLARILPRPYLPYVIICSTLEDIHDAVKIRDILTGEEHLIERCRILKIDSTSDLTAGLRKMNQITGISHLHEREQAKYANACTFKK